jgi:hypothetical protein
MRSTEFGSIRRTLSSEGDGGIGSSVRANGGGGSGIQELLGCPTPTDDPHHELWDIVWQANPRGTSRGLTLFHASTGFRIPLSVGTAFDAISTAVLRRGVVVVTGRGSLDNMNNGVIFIPRDRERPLYFTHQFVKAAAPTTDERRMLFTDQTNARLHYIDLRNVRGHRDAGSPYRIGMNASDTVWIGNTGPGPRGVVQGRSHGGQPGRIWVACKGSDGTCDEYQRNVSELDVMPRAQIRSFLAINPDTKHPTMNMAKDIIGRVNSDGSDDGLGPTVEANIPIGPRGICVAPNGEADDIWVTCYGYELFRDMDTRCQMPPITGTGRTLVRIRDDRASSGDPTPLGAGAVRVFTLGGGVNRGPLGIASDYLGNIYVVCSSSQELWKIPAGFEPSDGMTIPEFPLASETTTETDGWRLDLSVGASLDIPSGVSIDGYGRACVQFKNTESAPRITFVDSLGHSEDHFYGDLGSGSVATENVGDFTGYWTAVGLFPDDDSNHDGCTNIESVRSGRNPFKRPRRG